MCLHQFTERELTEKMTKFDNDIRKKVTTLETTLNEEIKHLKTKLIDMEDRSRRNNLRIDGLTESNNESWDECEEKVQSVLINKLGLKGVVIERAHRGSKSASKARKDVPRTVVLKLLNFQDKVKIMKNCKKLRNTGIYINEDFCKETNELRKKLWEDVKRLRQDGKYAVIQYNKIVTFYDVTIHKSTDLWICGRAV